MIKIYEYDSKEYKALEIASKMLEMESPNGTSYEVRDCYFDIGQDWMWTTIIANNRGGKLDYSWQALNPHNHKLIVSCDYESIIEGVRNTVNSEFNPDR